MLSACAQQPVFQLNQSASNLFENTDQQTSQQWYKLVVTWHWPQGQKIDWSLDGLLAHQVLGPWLVDSELDDLRDAPKLWRFHRRAAREGGHRFRLLMLATPEQAKSLEIWLATQPVWHEMQQQGLIEAASLSALSQNGLPLLAVGADPIWPEDLQQQWQFYIHGVSRMWLGLLGSRVQQQLLEDDSGSVAELDLDQLLALYKKVQDSMTMLWQEQGKHALLHHLNAIFAYQPLVIDQQWLMGF